MTKKFNKNKIGIKINSNLFSFGKTVSLFNRFLNSKNGKINLPTMDFLLPYRSSKREIKIFSNIENMLAKSSATAISIKDFFNISIKNSCINL